MDEDLRSLVGHLGATCSLDEGQMQRLIEDVLAFYSETLSAYAIRRHAQLKQRGWKNPAIYRQLTEELAQRRFAAEATSERQIRRMIYG